MKDLPDLRFCAVPWLDDRRGYLLDWTTQLWVRTTGKKVDLGNLEWLAGPTGATKGIGQSFFQTWADGQGWTIAPNDPQAGLLDGDDELLPPDLQPEVADFYRHTGRYRIEVEPSWCGIARPFGRLIAHLFSRRLQQLNLPFEGDESCLSSQVIVLNDGDGRRKATGWLRTKSTGEVVYVGIYVPTVLPDGTPALKVVFPLPNGNATVVMRSDVHPDGSLLLSSMGRRFGDDGFYFIVQHDDQTYVKFVRAMHERIHVYGNQDGLSALHTLQFMGFPFLTMKYSLEKGAKVVQTSAHGTTGDEDEA